MPPESLFSRIRRSWNVFRNGPEPGTENFSIHGSTHSTRPDRQRMNYGTEQSILSPIITRIGVDAAAVDVKHVRVDKNGSYLETINSGLNECLTVEANIDQSGRHFIQNAVTTLCDQGVIAIVPVDTTSSPSKSSAYEILTMRVGTVEQWHPRHVEVKLWNEAIGDYQNITIDKTQVAIIENPLYSIMNEPNSILKRLIDKINLLDVIDTQSGSGKLDLLFQLPFVIKTEARRLQAEERKAAIETQLRDSPYGIAYIDGTEKVTQLNRPAENNLMAQIEFLTRMLYGQLGITEGVFSGTATGEEMTHYYNRTIEPLLGAIAAGLLRTFVTKTGRTRGHSIMVLRDPFRLVSPELIPDMADKLTRNEIVTSNEFRGYLGLPPSKDPKADELRNKNINQPPEEPKDSKEANPVKMEGDS